MYLEATTPIMKLIISVKLRACQLFYENNSSVGHQFFSSNLGKRDRHSLSAKRNASLFKPFVFEIDTNADRGSVGTWLKCGSACRSRAATAMEPFRFPQFAPPSISGRQSRTGRRRTPRRNIGSPRSVVVENNLS